MEEEKFFNLEKDERREQISPKEVWIIDDAEETIKTILRFWQGEINDTDYNFRCFGTAQSAFDEIKKRKEVKKELPDLMFVDGLLEKDQGEFKRGENFIKKIRDMKEIKQPKIIAHSSIKENNEEMQKVGADFAFKKIEIRKTAQFLQQALSEKS